MNDPIANVVAFVEGRLDPADFEKLLYNDPELERTLRDDPLLKPGTYVGNSVFLYVLEQDFGSPGKLLNVHSALSDFLERRKIPFKPTHAHSDFYDTLLKAQPRWLDVPVDWLKQNVLSGANGRSGKELQDWLQAELLARFKYREKPPKWIQNPNWPIGENGPLVFLGQMKIPDYFHDEAAAYIFHDPRAGRFETVVQVY